MNMKGICYEVFIYRDKYPVSVLCYSGQLMGFTPGGKIELMSDIC